MAPALMNVDDGPTSLATRHDRSEAYHV